MISRASPHNAGRNAGAWCAGGKGELVDDGARGDVNNDAGGNDDASAHYENKHKTCSDDANKDDTRHV